MDSLFKTIDLGLSRLLRYSFPGFLFACVFALINRDLAIAIFGTLGWELTLICSLLGGIMLYAIHRSLIIPVHHLVGCLILWIGDLICGTSRDNSLSPTRWIGSLNPPVPLGRRMLAYANLRHSWFKDKNGNHDKERTEAWDAMHAENGLPVVLSEAFFVLSIYYWLAPLYADAQLELGKNGDPVLLLVLGGALFVLSALSGMQQHRVECAHFKTDINEAIKISSKFTDRSAAMIRLRTAIIFVFLPTVMVIGLGVAAFILHPWSNATYEHAFLNSRWMMSQREVEMANASYLVNPKYDFSGIGEPEMINPKRYKMKSISDIRLWGIDCKVNYEFFDDKLFEYTVIFTNSRNREFLDSVISSNISQKYSAAESVEGSTHLIERHWDAEKVSIKYWLNEMKSDHESEREQTPPPGFVLEKNFSAGVRITYKPMIQQIIDLAHEEQRKIF